MQNSYFHQKSQSLILSLFLHALLFLLFLYFIKVRHDHISDSHDGARKTPAPVVMQTKAPTPAVQQAIAGAPTIATPVPIPASVQQVTPAPQAEPVEQGPVQTETAGTDHGTEDAQGTPSLPSEPSGIEGGIRTGIPGKRGKSGISGADFRNALKGSLHREWHLQGKAAASGTPGSVVQERLNDWGRAHYLESIKKALNRACHLYSKYIKPHEPHNKRAEIEVVVLKNGTLGEINTKPTGIDEVDELLMNIFKATDFPPLPDRFNQDRFIFICTIQVPYEGGNISFSVT